MSYRKCPKCELNYINENQKICDSCAMEFYDIPTCILAIPRGYFITYDQMCEIENSVLQRGMKYNVKGRDYGIVLMSVCPDAQYSDKFECNGNIIIYEGHNIQSNFNDTGLPKNQVDQPMYTKSGKAFTENGNFFRAAERYKRGNDTEIIKVYQKTGINIWVYMGYYKLLDAWKEQSRNREVFKFKLSIINEKYDGMLSATTDKEQSRKIPVEVKKKVWVRDNGKCVKCGSSRILHYQYIIPISNKGFTNNADNIQINCENCKFKKLESK